MQSLFSFDVLPNRIFGLDGIGAEVVNKYAECDNG